MGFSETEESKHIVELDRAEGILDAHILQAILSYEDFKRIVEQISMQPPSSAERCLFCLAIHPEGLTPLEMSKQIYFKLPIANAGSLRLKTVSMKLHRYVSEGLARRIRKGKTYKYFLTANGHKRFQYLRATRAEKEKEIEQQIIGQAHLLLQYLSDQREVIRAEKILLAYQELANERAPYFGKLAAHIMKWCVELAMTILTLKRSLIDPYNLELRNEALAESEQCLAGLTNRLNTMLHTSMLMALINSFSAQRAS